MSNWACFGHSKGLRYDLEAVRNALRRAKMLPAIVDQSLARLVCVCAMGSAQSGTVDTGEYVGEVGARIVDCLSHSASDDYVFATKPLASLGPLVARLCTRLSMRCDGTDSWQPTLPYDLSAMRLLRVLTACASRESREALVSVLQQDEMRCTIERCRATATSMTMRHTHTVDLDLPETLMTTLLGEKSENIRALTMISNVHVSIFKKSGAKPAPLFAKVSASILATFEMIATDEALADTRQHLAETVMGVVGSLVSHARFTKYLVALRVAEKAEKQAERMSRRVYGLSMDSLVMTGRDAICEALDCDDGEEDGSKWGKRKNSRRRPSCKQAREVMAQRRSSGRRQSRLMTRLRDEKQLGLAMDKASMVVVAEENDSGVDSSEERRESDSDSVVADAADLDYGHESTSHHSIPCVAHHRLFRALTQHTLNALRELWHDVAQHTSALICSCEHQRNHDRHTRQLEILMAHGNALMNRSMTSVSIQVSLPQTVQDYLKTLAESSFEQMHRLPLIAIVLADPLARILFKETLEDLALQERRARMPVDTSPITAAIPVSETLPLALLLADVGTFVGKGGKNLKDLVREAVFVVFQERTEVVTAIHSAVEPDPIVHTRRVLKVTLTVSDLAHVPQAMRAMSCLRERVNAETTRVAQEQKVRLAAVTNRQQAWMARQEKRRARYASRGNRVVVPLPPSAKVLATLRVHARRQCAHTYKSKGDRGSRKTLANVAVPKRRELQRLVREASTTTAAVEAQARSSQLRCRSCHGDATTEQCECHEGYYLSHEGFWSCCMSKGIDAAPCALRLCHDWRSTQVMKRGRARNDDLYQE